MAPQCSSAQELHANLCTNRLSCFCFYSPVVRRVYEFMKNDGGRAWDDDERCSLVNSYHSWRGTQHTENCGKLIEETWSAELNPRMRSAQNLTSLHTSLLVQNPASSRPTQHYLTSCAFILQMWCNRDFSSSVEVFEWLLCREEHWHSKFHALASVSMLR